MLAGPWTQDAMTQRCARSIARATAPGWIGQLVADVLGYFRDPPRDSPRLLQDLLLVLPAWHAGAQVRAAARSPTPRARGRRREGLQAPVDRLDPRHWQPTSTAMGAAPWPVRPLPTIGDLAALLDIDTAELAWFADVRGWERRAPARALRHYRVVVRAKPGGVRVLEVPKARLREMQRRVLRHVLMPIPVHPNAHGCVAGRSVATAVAPHAGHGIVVRADLEAFFPSIAAGRIYGILRSAGYPAAVAHALTGLTTTTLAQSSWRAVPGSGEAHYRLGRSLAVAHLPQGAPTSPALANLAAFHLDKRLAGLAGSFGATYTRYVDDLVFSGPTLRAGRLLVAVADIAADEGFGLAQRKSVVLSRAGRQQVLGAVVNDRVGVARPEVDRLRAILHNCLVTGWSAQARGHDGMQFRQHLGGRIAWVNSLDPARGRRLLAQFDAIDWSTV